MADPDSDRSHVTELIIYNDPSSEDLSSPGASQIPDLEIILFGRQSRASNRRKRRKNRLNDVGSHVSEDQTQGGSTDANDNKSPDPDQEDTANSNETNADAISSRAKTTVPNRILERLQRKYRSKSGSKSDKDVSIEYLDYF